MGLMSVLEPLARTVSTGLISVSRLTIDLVSGQTTNGPDGTRVADNKVVWA